MPTRILGISAYYHDSAAALVQDGVILAAAQEERFTRVKHDACFPRHAISYCMQAAGARMTDLDLVVYYEKPLAKFDRLLETSLSYAPRGLRSFLASMPVWLKEKLYLKMVLTRELAALGQCEKRSLPPLLFSEHHQAHAASAFFPSPFPRAAVLCMDGVGEWATTSAWLGDGNTLTPLWQMDFPHSLGLLYSAFTCHAGFRVNAGEYKLMGLAPYGEPRYVQAILDNVVDLKEDGTFRLDMRYFDFAAGSTMTSRHFDALFDGPPRMPESPLTRREMDLACSIQRVVEDIVLRLARSVHRDLGTDALCLAGGVALNCVANGRLVREGPFRDIWIQPAAGDAGGALGAALAAWHQHLQKPRPTDGTDRMQGSLLGPSFSNEQVRDYLDSVHAVYRELPDAELSGKLADLLIQQKVIGYFQGRMEFGPRALGNRSILGDARSPDMQAKMNTTIKKRESFRPFAPSILEEDARDYFELERESPYMQLTAEVKADKRTALTNAQTQLTGLEKLRVPRSVIPAVTHVDHTARVQTVKEALNGPFYRLLKAFKARTGCGVLLNTSFNVRGEPIVHSPADAYRCFMRTDMDCLAIGNMLLFKHEQPAWRGGQENKGRSAACSGPADIPEPSSQELRRFSGVVAGALAVSFGLVMPWLLNRGTPFWPWILSAVLALWGCLHPASLRPAHRAWMVLARVLARVNTALLLGGFFLFLITPVGVAMRLFRYDPLQRRGRDGARSSRRPSTAPVQGHMERPF